MDQYETRQTAMQDDIDTLKSKMDQLMEMLTAQHTREEERAAAAAAATAVAVATAAAAATTVAAIANNATNIVPPVVTGNVRTLRGGGNAPFPGVQAPNPPFYGMPTDFFNGAENQGNVAAAHAATQTMGNDEQEQEEDEQENLWSTTPQGEEDQQDDYMRQFY